MTAATVQQALASVMAELPGIGKDDKAPQGYAYRGIEAITKKVQPLLAKHGVVLVPSAEITDVRPSPAMKEGWQDIYMRVAWKVVGPDGSMLEAQTFGIGRDNSDKGSNKAMTQAFKYLLLDLLCIADAKDDADGVSYDHAREERTPADGPISAENAKALTEKCDAAGLDVAKVVDLGTAGRTDDPALVLRSEIANVKAAYDKLAAKAAA